MPAFPLLQSDTCDWGRPRNVDFASPIGARWPGLDAIMDVLLPSPSPFHMDLILVDWGPPASGWFSFQDGALWVRGRSSALP